MARHDRDLGTVLRGVGASPGIVLGDAWRLERDEKPVEHVHLPASLVEAEVQRLMAALVEAEEEIDALDRSVVAAGQIEGDHLSVLDAHKVMLRDPMLLGETERHIREQGLNAEWALELTVAHLVEIFERMADPFFRERAVDVRHVGEQIRRALHGEATQHLVDAAPGGSVVVADDLSPAEALALARRPVAAFVLDIGTTTSHTAIVAQGMGIPAVLGLQTATEHIGTGDRIIVDGSEGEVIVHPSQYEELVYERRARRKRAFLRALKQNRALPATTREREGAEEPIRTVALKGNLDVLDECSRIRDAGGRGVGLFRTEFLFIEGKTLPTEEEQLTAYSRVLEAVHPHEVTIRTLDIGGDKTLPVERPGLGSSPDLRAIRYCLKDEELFRTQLRALLRASTRGRLRLLIPFVTTWDEVQQVRALLEDVEAKLRAEGIEVAEDIPLGFMIETPAAALFADRIAESCDFLSVGTNDLIQYTLAVSRVDSAVGHLYQPLHPGLLRLLEMVVEAGHAAGVEVAMCGEMASDPRYAMVLLALGFDELSMNPDAIPLVKEIVRRATMDEAVALTRRIFEMRSGDEIADYVDSYMVEHFPDVVSPRMRKAPRYAR